ncbi:MAG: LLM class flavin-dependent oxidoreductase [Pseudomonadota bacterium]
MRLSYAAPFSRPEHRRNAVAYAQLAEAAGYDAVWVPEAFSSDALTLLGLIAGQTTRLKLATGIVNVFSRTPALLAQSFATLDEISDGRAIIGLGTSGPRVIENWHGLRFEKPLGRLRETVEILRLALSGARVDYDGAIFKLDGFKLAVRPVQARIPIYLATFKPNAVRQTGAIADGWLPTHVSVRRVEALRAGLVDGARAAGRDPGAIDMAALTLVACTPDGEIARDLCRQHLAYYVGGMGTFYQELLDSYGYGALAERIKTLWAAGDRDGAARAIPRDVLDDLAIAGTRAECRAGLDARRAAGFGHIVVFPPHGIDPAQLRDTLTAIAG